MKDRIGRSRQGTAGAVRHHHKPVGWPDGGGQEFPDGKIRVVPNRRAVADGRNICAENDGGFEIHDDNGSCAGAGFGHALVHRDFLFGNLRANRSAWACRKSAALRAYSAIAPGRRSRARQHAGARVSSGPCIARSLVALFRCSKGTCCCYNLGWLLD